MAKYLTWRACPACQTATATRQIAYLEDFQLYTDKPDNRLVLADEQCLGCGLCYRNPTYTPEGAAYLFAEAGASFGSGQAAEQGAWLRERIATPRPRVLDLGAYDGRLLLALPAQWDRQGVEPDAPAVTRGRAAGLDLRQGDAAGFLAAASADYDLFTALHTLEHMHDPYHVLRALRRLAHPQTQLVAEIPVIDRGQTNDVGGFFVPEHVIHWSKATFAAALLMTGWDIQEEVDCQGYNGYRVLCSPGDTTGHRMPCPPGLHEMIDALCEDSRMQARVVASRLHDTTACLPEQRPLCLWGAGIHTEWLWHRTGLAALSTKHPLMLVDSDPLKHGKRWRGWPISPPATLGGMHPQPVVIVSSYGSQEAIAQGASALGIPDAQIITLYDECMTY